MTGFVPLLVRAHLSHGIAHAAPWSVSLDGLLASQIWQQRKTELIANGRYEQRALQQTNPPDLELPLATCDADASQWHWAATCAYPENPLPDVHVHTWTSRVDRRDLEDVADYLPKVVSERQGRYKARCMPLLTTVCTALTWHAIGDPAAIGDLLEPIRTVGKKRTSGEGEVLGWEVTPQPELSPFAAAHLHPDGSLGRPTPTACLPQDWVGVDGGPGMAGIRPPYMHHSRTRQVRLPAILGGAA